MASSAAAPALPPLSWLPTEIVPGNPVIVRWTDFGSAPLSESFYGESRQRVARLFSNWSPRTTRLDALVDAEQPDSIAPSGLIFHMSRCGSTLVSQMLAASDRNIMLSEPEVVDELLRCPGMDEERKIAALRALAAALGRNRTGRAERAFIKFDAWHVRSMPLILRAFPDVPWVFLHRDPVEVIVSQLRSPGLHARPGALPPEALGVAPGLPPLEHIAQVLARISEAVLDHAEGGCIVDYSTLPEAVFTRILPHFGVIPAEEERAAMAAASARSSKRPQQAFAADSAAKQQEATPEVRAAVAEHLAAFREDLLSRS